MSEVDTTLPPMPSDPPAGCPMAPAPEFSLLRATAPVQLVTLADGTPVWLLTRHDDVRAVLRDPRFSSVTTRPGFPTYGLPGRDTAEFARSIIRLDEPEHLRLRRLLTKEFMPRRVAEHEDLVHSVVSAHLDVLEQAGPPGDFAQGFALAVPSALISEMLGVPQQDHAFFQDATRRHTVRHGNDDDVAAAITELNDYMLRLAADKAKDPQDDLLSLLVGKAGEGALSMEDVAAYATLLVAAGHDTTAGSLALSILTLIQQPDQLARLRQNPYLWDGAVEELLRYHSVVRGGPRRLAMEDVEVGGHLIRAGQGVMVSVWAANHDDGQFDDPGTIDVTRENVRSHLAFGYGTHQCLGQSLARMEMRIGLTEVFDRFPSLAVADPEALRFRTDTTNYGLHTMPLTW